MEANESQIEDHQLTLGNLYYLKDMISSSIQKVRFLQEDISEIQNKNQIINDNIKNEIKQTLKDFNGIVGDNLYKELINVNERENHLINNQIPQDQEIINDERRDQLIDDPNDQIADFAPRFSPNLFNLIGFLFASFLLILVIGRALNGQAIFQDFNQSFQIYGESSNLLSDFIKNQPKPFGNFINMLFEKIWVSNNETYLPDTYFGQKIQRALRNLPQKVQEARKKVGPFNYWPEPNDLKLREWRVVQYSDGIYEGEVQYGTHIRCGKGIAVLDNGILYEGWHSNDRMNGKARKIFSNGDVMENDKWIDDKANGYGIVHYYNGDIYQGEYLNHKFHGYGKLSAADGLSYEGEFRNGNFNGKGTLTYENGDSLESNTWKDNLEHGFVILTTSENGKRYAKKFEMGTLISSNEL